MMDKEIKELTREIYNNYNCRLYESTAESIARHLYFTGYRKTQPLTYVYPGSFDPVTKGHLDIIIRAAALADKLIVAVMVNPDKQSAFTTAERVEFIRCAVANAKLTNVEVESFDGLLAEYAKMKNAAAIVKGLRALSDFEYEFQMAMTNRLLNSELETIFLTTSSENMFLSSSMVKQIARFGGDISPFVPECIAPAMTRKMLDKVES